MYAGQHNPLRKCYFVLYSLTTHYLHKWQRTRDKYKQQQLKPTCGWILGWSTARGISVPTITWRWLSRASLQHITAVWQTRWRRSQQSEKLRTDTSLKTGGLPQETKSEIKETQIVIVSSINLLWNRDKERKRSNTTNLRGNNWFWT